MSFGPSGVVTTDGFDTMAYLELFGGNEDDSGGADKTNDWWGNDGEVDGAKRYRSRFHHLLRTLPATSGNLKRLQAAGVVQLEAAFVATKIANGVSLSLTIPRKGRLNIVIEIDAYGRREAFVFTENWENAV